MTFRPPASRRNNPAPDVLIPETVKRGASKLGRFEITRAQYAAFDKDYKFDAGHGKFSGERHHAGAGARLIANG